MRRLKKMLVGVLALAMVMSFLMSVPAYAAGDEFTVHASVPSEWAAPGLWAWSAPDGTNVFAAWPGEKLTKDEANEGWYSYSVPSWTNSIIINDEGVQTVDVSIESKELWITVTAANAEGKFEADVVYEAPEGFQAAEAAAAETTEEATAETTAETTGEEMPKTGDLNLTYVFLGMMAATGVGYIVIRRKKAAF